MIGRGDSAGRALLDIELRASKKSSSEWLTAWIDTGFTGELVLPATRIEELSLTLTGTVSAVLADGSRTAMTTYECFVHWFGEWRRLDVVANEGATSLLGIGLLLERELRIDYRSNFVELE